ncbi:MAG: hypothetical protein FD131_1612 [Rhodocyclaceae bacterium]|nr:MAG: hypothetical protein FD131_1612 [Rhodocyclaceae bacterium]
MNRLAKKANGEAADHFGNQHEQQRVDDQHEQAERDQRQGQGQENE